MTRDVPFRVGCGYDLHRLEPGRPLVVAGIRLAHDRGCAAHSDGDVVLHALTDALLGAVGSADIGELFPDDDPRWASADSAVFVGAALERVREAGFEPVNADLTVLLERPKLAPHKGAIRARLAGLLEAPDGRVNLKTKTHEGVDAVGEGRAIACHAVVLVGRGGSGDRA